MWRSIGWLFSQGWSMREMLALWESEVVERRLKGSRKEVLIEDDADLGELRQAAMFVLAARRKGQYREAAERVTNPESGFYTRKP